VHFQAIMARPSDPHARQRILDAARHEFVSKGLDRARVEDIARLAQVSKGAFYLHFEGKEQAFDELVLEVASGLERMLDQLGDEVGDASSSAERWVARCFKQDLQIFEFIRDNRGMMALMFEGGGSARHQHLIESFAQRTERVVEAALTHGMAVGFYRSDLDVPSAAAFIAGGYDRVARRLVYNLLDREPEVDLASHLSCVIRQLVAGVGTPQLIKAAQQLLPSSRAVAGSSPGTTSTPHPCVTHDGAALSVSSSEPPPAGPTVQGKRVLP
jgi:AcrR family transcriptional regulator